MGNASSFSILELLFNPMYNNELVAVHECNWLKPIGRICLPLVDRAVFSKCKCLSKLS